MNARKKIWNDNSFVIKIPFNNTSNQLSKTHKTNTKLKYLPFKGKTNKKLMI